MKISEILEKNFCYDSRVLKKNDVFFDFLSDSKSNNPYLKSVIQKKPFLIITKKKINYKKILIVNDIKKIYFSLIKKKFRNIPQNLYAVTGTNGKTSVASFFFQIYRLNNLSCANIGTLGYYANDHHNQNNLTTPDNYDIFKFLNFVKKKKINSTIIEASSHGLHQGRLNGLKFKGVVFTNFSHDHLDYHKSMKSYFNSKLILFKKNLARGSKIICNNKIAKKLNQFSSKKKYNFILQKKNKDIIKIILSKPQGSKTKVKINYNNTVFNYSLNLIGTFQLENLYNAIMLSVSSGLKIKQVFKVLPKVKPIKGRLNVFTKHNKTICLDYAHTPDGLKKVIITLKNHFKKKVNIVFGCGGNRDKGKRIKMGKIVKKLCNKIIITNDNPRFENPVEINKQIYNSIKRGLIISNRKLAISKGIKNLAYNEVLLIAGKGHENYQIINDKKIYFSDHEEILKNL